MTTVDRKPLERVTNIDLMLIQKFARRTLTRSLRYKARVRRLMAPTIADLSTTGMQEPSISTGVMAQHLGGLEVYFGGGNSLNVAAGAMLIDVHGTGAAGPAAVRPASWSGQDDVDDDVSIVAELPNDATPTLPVISSALTNYEWWGVFATPALVWVESDSNRKVFNETTGNFDAATAAKIACARLSIAVVRGSAGSTPARPTVGSVPLAWVYVPLGATDLSAAVIFDARRITDMWPGPNMVGGNWSVPFVGTLTGPADTNDVFQGQVWARLNNEILEARVFTGMKIGHLVEPGATWDATASTSHPKIAWLYLSRFNIPGDTASRLMRPTTTALGNFGNAGGAPGAITGQIGSPYFAGTLVLSPKPPFIGSGKAASGQQSPLKQRWDLTNSAAINLPTANDARQPYPLAGCTAQIGDAICVGFMRYTGVVSSTPQIVGGLDVDSDGWFGGDAMTGGGGGIVSEGVLAAGFPLFSGSVGTTAAPMTIDMQPSQVTVGSDTYQFPMKAARVTANFQLNLQANTMWRGAARGKLSALALSPTPEYFAELEVRMTVNGGGAFPQLKTQLPTGVSYQAPGVYGAAFLTAIRFPYNEPLAT